MKLIDILVRELPKRGCWPVGVDNITQYKCGGLCFNSSDGCCIDACPDISLEPHEDGFPDWAYGVKVTREQYEAALASSNTEWNGEGLPPVGCECEFQAEDGSWGVGTVLYVGRMRVFWLCHEDGFEYNADIEPREFRPIRSEADKKKEEVLSQIANAIIGAQIANAIIGDVPDTGMATAAMYAERIYGAIKSGKFTGVKLED